MKVNQLCNLTFLTLEQDAKHAEEFKTLLSMFEMLAISSKSINNSTTPILEHSVTKEIDIQGLGEGDDVRNQDPTSERVTSTPAADMAKRSEDSPSVSENTDDGKLRMLPSGVEIEFSTSLVSQSGSSPSTNVLFSPLASDNSQSVPSTADDGILTIDDNKGRCMLPSRVEIGLLLELSKVQNSENSISCVRSLTSPLAFETSTEIFPLGADSTTLAMHETSRPVLAWIRLQSVASENITISEPSVSPATVQRPHSPSSDSVTNLVSSKDLSLIVQGLYWFYSPLIFLTL